MLFFAKDCFFACPGVYLQNTTIKKLREIFVMLSVPLVFWDIVIVPATLIHIGYVKLRKLDNLIGLTILSKPLNHSK